MTRGTVSATEMVTFILFINVFLNPIERLVNFTEAFQRGCLDSTVFEYDEQEPEIIDSPNAVELKSVRGEIVLMMYPSATMTRPRC